MDTNLFQFLIPEMYNKYGPYNFLNINITCFDAPKLVMTNNEEEGANIAVHVPMRVHFHVQTNNETGASEEAFLVKTKLIANATIEVLSGQGPNGSDMVQLHVKNSSSFTTWETSSQNNIDVPILFYDLFNSFRQWAINLVIGPWAYLL